MQSLNKRLMGRLLNKDFIARVLLLCGILSVAVQSPVLANTPWNSPYSQDQVASKTLFSSFDQSPKHLDPVVSYSSNEWSILGQIYEPPLQYHYLKRPYTLEPLTLTQMPTVRYLDQHYQPLDEQNVADPAMIVYSEYTFHLKPGVLYQPHPAFAQDAAGQPLYFTLDQATLNRLSNMTDLQQGAQRELLAADYVYALKRMALRQNHSPILDSMTQYIVGLDELSKTVTELYQAQLDTEKSQAQTRSAEYLGVKASYFDLNKHSISGVQVIDSHQFKITIKGKYPQFLYWLSMNFFAPIPWEAERFYKQPGLVKKNLTLDTSPVGTGPYQLVENNPNKQMRLLKNPNYRLDVYPSDGLAEGADPKLLADAGKPIPFIDEVIYSLEKESVPLWNKFLQGYYDASGVSSDSFDQAITVSSSGSMSLTPEMAEKGIQFLNVIQPSTLYFGFNMADEVVGGYSEKQQKLRQAISIAINFEEYISIFMNGRGVAAQGPIPPGIFGFTEGAINPYVYDWLEHRAQRKSIEQAKELLAQAGYPNGRMANGEPLVLHYDTAATGPDSQSLLNWYRKQFAKLGIELVVRSTDYNRFQDKVRGAKAQMFSWGWNADYPDPENFLFLLNGANAAINTNGAGINSANYDNPKFNQLFSQMQSMENSTARQAIIDEMVQLVQQDAPWAWGYHPQSLALYHRWYHNSWANPLANNTLKYKRIEPELRQTLQSQWNQAVLWPLWLVLLAVVAAIYPLRKAYRQRQNATLKTLAAIAPQSATKPTFKSNLRE